MHRVCSNNKMNSIYAVTLVIVSLNSVGVTFGHFKPLFRPTQVFHVSNSTALSSLCSDRSGTIFSIILRLRWVSNIFCWPCDAATRFLLQMQACLPD